MNIKRKAHKKYEKFLSRRVREFYLAEADRWVKWKQKDQVSGQGAIDALVGLAGFIIGAALVVVIYVYTRG